MMKIGILTLPLHTNYGGLVQAFALQKVLIDLGYDAITVHRVSKPKLSVKIESLIKRTIKKYILGRFNLVIKDWPSESESRIIAQHTDKFIERYIRLTEAINSPMEYHKLNKMGFDGYVVGSDQVWRMYYTPGMPSFFLDFTKDIDNVKRVAYAASFGVDDWEFSEKMTQVCGSLAQSFNAISVREDSGVELCEKYFKVKAEHTLDPTLLVNRQVYSDMIDREHAPLGPNVLYHYVLDKSADKLDIINKVAAEKRLRVVAVMPQKKFSEVGSKGLESCIFPSVTEWLRGFRDAEFIVTDSFHGTVFSIIFNKPFIAIGNESRGMSRFQSLLKMFGLEDRLVFRSEQVNRELINRPIDYHKVDELLESYKRFSLGFLTKALNE